VPTCVVGLLMCPRHLPSRYKVFRPSGLSSSPACCQGVTMITSNLISR